MKTRLTALFLSILFLSLTACQGRFVPSAASPSPPARSTPQPPVTEPPATAEPHPPAPAISLAEYHAMAAALSAKIVHESEILIRAGLYEYNWWSACIGDTDNVDLNAMLDEAMGWLSESFDSNAAAIDAACNDLIADYTALTYANVDAEIPSEVADQVDRLFAAYYQLYTVVTRPSGTVQEFARMLCSCTYSITTASARLDFTAPL